MRPVLTTTTAILTCTWLAYELKRKISPFKHWRWLVGIFLVQVVGEVIGYNLDNALIGNLLLHAIGGGVVTSILYFYLSRSFDYHPSIRLEIISLFLLVSCTGVINEIYEYVFELLRVGTFSFDSHDTWRDLAANTAGAVIGFIYIKILLRYTRLKSQEHSTTKTHDK